MTALTTENAVAGAWRAHLIFTEGPRRGEQEPVFLTFLPGGVIVHADEIPAENGQLPRGIGEWTMAGEGFSYWFNVVLNDPAGRPTIVAYVHGSGSLAPDRQTLTASGGSEVYGSAGELLATTEQTSARPVPRIAHRNAAAQIPRSRCLTGTRRWTRSAPPSCSRTIASACGR